MERCIGWHLDEKYCILFKWDLNYFYTIEALCMSVCGEWRVATGTDYVPVILFITVGAHGVSVVDSMIYIHLLQDGNPSPHV